MDVRYKVKLGSESRHCCFEATVVDTEASETVCECFNLADAIRIAGAMNRTVGEAKDALAFLEKIEGAGYGGMADYEVARQSLRSICG